MAELPHIAYPRRLDVHGKVVVNEQDSVEHVAACVYAIATCVTGQMPLIPTFGVPSPLFRSVPLDLTALVKAVGDQEPRAHVTATEQADLLGAAIRDISLVALVEQGPHS